MPIQLVLKIKDGMVSLVFKFHAHPTHITTVPSVYAQTQEITASLGNTMMELDVFINLALAQKEQPGTAHTVPLVTTVLQDFILQVQHVHHYLKGVFLHLHGQMDVAR